MEDLKIAVGARTPLYLPLYVAAAQDFYKRVPKDARFELEKPGNQGDGDKHVKNKMISKDCDFGVCDPRVVFGEDELVAIASLVSRAGFWIYRRGCHGGTISDLSKLKAKKVITYPDGMTGQLLAERSIPHVPAFALKGLTPGSDFERLMEEDPSEDPSAVLVTSDILKGARYEQQSSAKCIYSYSSDPQHGNLLTTAVIARREMLEDPSHIKYTRGLIEALQIACIEIAYKPTDRKIVDALTEKMQVASDERTLIKKIITKMCIEEALFSTRLGIDKSTWTRVATTVGNGGQGDNKPAMADEARRKLLIKPANFSLKASIFWRNMPLISLRNMPLISLRNMPLVLGVFLFLAPLFVDLNKFASSILNFITLIGTRGGAWWKTR